MFPDDTSQRYYPENSVYNPLNDVLLHSSENIPRYCLFYFPLLSCFVDLICLYKRQYPMFCGQKSGSHTFGSSLNKIEI